MNIESHACFFLWFVPAVFAFTDFGQTNEMIPFDDPRIKGWAAGHDAFERGLMNYTSPAGGYASYGHPDSATGPVTGGSVDGVVSLGDGGRIDMTFDLVLADGPGPDIVVFENGFGSPGGVYAELAFVEISSNGSDFVRVPNICRNTSPVSGFGSIDPDDYYNYCGTGIAGNTSRPFGTGIDFADAAGQWQVISGLVKLDSVAHVRLIDVIGDGVTSDFFGSPVYDPFPTAFSSGGCDFNGIAAINTRAESPVAIPALSPSNILLVSLCLAVMGVCSARRMVP